MENKCNDKFFLQPIELCSIDALNKIKDNNNNSIYDFDSNSIFKSDIYTHLIDLNYKFRDNQSNNDYIYKYEGTEEEPNKNKNLCEQTNKIDEYYLNCVLSTNNPLFTFKDGYCMLSPDFTLPNELKKIQNKNDITIKLDRNNLHDEEGNFKFQQVKNNKYCEDRWFDWIVIPNYHFGNRILKDSGAYSKEDVKVCYKNCKEGELPYINSKGDNLCIPKEIAYDGIYENKLDYSPLSLINLIGNNKKHINLLYKNMYFYKLNQKIKTNKYNINENVNLSENLENNNNYIVNNVFEEIKIVLNKIVNDNNLDIPDYSFEYKHLTYKHPNFKENTLITIMGMDKNEILSNDIILIHTVYLAYNYYKFLNDIISDNTSFIKKDNTIDIRKHDNNIFNINNNLYELDIKSYKTYYDNVNIVILDSLKTGDNYVDNQKTKKKRQRLANILYKAINICYDKKTDFSKNLINRTIEAFNRYDINIIKSISLLQKDFIKFSDEDINIYNKFIIENKSNIINGFEINYYKYNYLNNIYDNIGRNQFIFKLNNDEEARILKNIYNENFKFYTEEESEIINGNTCKSGKFLKDNICVSCDENCNTIEKCNNDTNCKTYCQNICIKNNENQNMKCGGTTSEETNKKPLKEKQKEIKTPIEEDTIFPDFSYIFKSGIKIFFILISLYIAYMFYKIFNETILTFANLIYGFFESLYYNKLFFTENIKIAEHYKKNIQDKYNRIIRKTMT